MVFEKIIDLQNDNYFFMYSGALIIPMIWLRGYDFNNYEKVTYQMLPSGFAEIKQLPHNAYLLFLFIFEFNRRTGKVYRVFFQVAP